jgi:hypothetical protein
VRRGTGVLAYDVDNDHKIDRKEEIAFTGYKPGAKTDLEGLTAFDSNGNGQLDTQDKSWRRFGVWVDADGDGVSDAGEFRSLDEVGIVSIGLKSDSQKRRLDGVTVHGLAAYQTRQGKTGTVGDVSFDTANPKSQALIQARLSKHLALMVDAMGSWSGATASGMSGLRLNGADVQADLHALLSRA